MNYNKYFIIGVVLGGISSCLTSNAQIVGSLQRVSQHSSYSYNMVINSDSVKRFNDVWFVSQDRIRESVVFLDELGRPALSTQFNVSSDLDLIKVFAYDEFGMQSYSYLPFAAVSNMGDINNPLNSQQSFYNNSSTYGIKGDSKAFTKTVFEKSPLERVVSVTEPGSDWHNSSKCVTYSYGSNTANYVRRFAYSANGTFTGSAFYPAGELVMQQVTDANGNVQRKYSEKSGRVILVEQSGLQTYYLYDSFGRLSIVLPPLAVQSLPSLGYVVNPDNAILNGLVFRYVYDSKSRIASKSIPSREPIEFVYDKLDRVIMTRDGNLRAQNKWKFMKYDIFGRTVCWGIKTYTLADNREKMQQFSDASSDSTFETFLGTNSASLYSLNGAYPIVTSSDVYEFYVYDNYFKSKFKASELVNLGAPSDTGSAKGLATYVKTKVLGSSNWMESWFFYDSYGRLLQSVRKNAINNSAGGGTEQYTSSKYSFGGQVEASRFTHYTSGVARIAIKYYFQYTPQGQVGSIDVEIPGTGGLPRSQLVSYEYNPLGELVKRNLDKSGAGYLQQVDYFYNIRGWLTDINDVNTASNDLFRMKLHYQEGFSALGGVPRYDGLLSGVEWITKHSTDSTRMGYGYGYDSHKRLLSASYGAGSSFASSKGRYNENFSYDSNGNIVSLTRFGETAVGNFGEMDKLVYTYSGNRVVNISDARANVSNPLSFRDVAGTGVEYTYDANGNTLTDANRGITSVVYNEINLPNSITVVQGGSTTQYGYAYSAAGEKLKASVGGITLYYDGPLTFSGTSLASISTPEGRITCNGFASYTQEYSLTDNQGNVRVAFTRDAVTGKAKAASVNHYYPSGLELNTYRVVSGAVNRFGFGGKEEIGLPLNMLDFHARLYDPTSVRWSAVDPLAEEDVAVSPYAYCYSNPVNFTDPTGLKPLLDPINPRDMAYEELRVGRMNGGGVWTGGPASGSLGYRHVGKGVYIDRATGEEVGFPVVSLYYSPLIPKTVNGYTLYSGNLVSISSRDYVLMVPNPDYMKPQGGGGDGSLAMDIASGSATGFGLATSLRYKLEWEYLSQARINRAISGDFSKPIRHSLRSIRWAGSGFTIAGGIIGGVNFAISDKSWGDYGQLGVSMLSTGLTLGSVTAPIGIGIGLIDAFGGFDGFYNYLDNQQNFYNNTGGIMVPLNGIPSFIPLK